MTVVKERPRADRRRSMVMIQRLVGARTEMLSLYTLLARQKPFNDIADVQMLLQEFCQSLVDYTANAHFQLYRYFAENNERRKEIYDVAVDIYPKVLKMTNTILDFNDKYDCGDHCSHFNNLENDLSGLGEVLADRIEMEDQLITAFGYNLDN
jgi:regulator of sigma D